jgi:hypothetical protein
MQKSKTPPGAGAHRLRRPGAQDLSRSQARERFEHEVRVLRYLETRGCDFVPRVLEAEPDELKIVTTNCGKRVDQLNAGAPDRALRRAGEIRRAPRGPGVAQHHLPHRRRPLLCHRFRVRDHPRLRHRPPRLPEAFLARHDRSRRPAPSPGLPPPRPTCWSGLTHVGRVRPTTRTPFSPLPSTATRCATSAKPGTPRSPDAILSSRSATAWAAPSPASLPAASPWIGSPGCFRGRSGLSAAGMGPGFATC